MRGFIKPRFTRLHMPFRAKTERSCHSFHLQAVGLALALLSGVLCDSFWQHASQQNVYLSYFAEQYLAGHNTGSFSAAMSRKSREIKPRGGRETFRGGGRSG